MLKLREQKKLDLQRYAEQQIEERKLAQQRVDNVVKVQSRVRAFLARQVQAEVMDAVLLFAICCGSCRVLQLLEHRRRRLAATRIQALIRGILGRRNAACLRRSQHDLVRGRE